MLKTFFFGTPEFSLPSLQALSEETQLRGVVTQPDRPRGRGQKLSPCETKAWALDKKIPVYSPPSLRKDSEERARLLADLEKAKPDLFLVTAYGLIFPEDFLKIPRLGAFNVHASLLPRWRGAAPIQRAIEAGDQESGVCLQRMVFELDAGDVYAEKKIPILEEDDAAALSQKLSQASYPLVKEFLASKGAEQKEGRKQDSKRVTFAEKIKKEEGFWKPSWSPEETSRRIRAFSVWPRVSAGLEEGSEVKLLATKPASISASAAAGDLLVEKGRVFLFTGQPAKPLEITRIQLPGKAPCAAFDYFQNAKTRTKLRGL